MKRLWLFSTFGILFQFVSGLAGVEIRPDDPLWVDDDRVPIEQPNPIQLSELADILRNTFLNRPEGKIAPAENANTIGGVPDSSWFTNRLGRREMSIEEVVRGSNLSGPPDPDAAWEVVGVKTEGLTPGLTIRDASGARFLIKFDPYRYPQLNTSAEVIVTKFFHALGYNVPENYLVVLDPSNLTISSEAVIEEHDELRPLTERDLQYLIDRVPRCADGTIRVVASRFIEGGLLGPFRYHGTRSDDANDIFPHENRRELRGMRLFAAWLNHDDSRSINTLDSFVEGEGGDGKGFVRHYLIDFGSTLGSGTIFPQDPRAGNEYVFEKGPALKAALSLGLWDREWRDISYPDHPGIGNFEAEAFDPPAWKPEYPNPAFERMLAGDALWAAAILGELSPEMIAAVVETARFDDPESEQYLIDTLILRREKILRYYLARVNPLWRFEIAPGSSEVKFENLAKGYLLAPDVEYRYCWLALGSQAKGMEVPEGTGTSSSTRIPLPNELSSEIAKVRIRTEPADFPGWSQWVDVYVRRQSEEWKVVAVEREGADLPIAP